MVKKLINDNDKCLRLHLNRTACTSSHTENPFVKLTIWMKLKIVSLHDMKSKLPVLCTDFEDNLT